MQFSAAPFGASPPSRGSGQAPRWPHKPENRGQYPVPPLRIHVLLSWWNERPEHLAEMVASVAPLADSLVAVDGPYPLFPHDRVTSSAAEYAALRSSCDEHGLELHTFAPGALSEVDKRTFMFDSAMSIAEPRQDWFLILDGDMVLAWADVERARHRLARAAHLAAEVTLADPNTRQSTTDAVRPFRSLFRATPGMAVEGTHAYYTAPGRQWLWQAPPGSAPVPALDLTAEVILAHRFLSEREQTRGENRMTYYTNRSDAAIESVPAYHD